VYAPTFDDTPDDPDGVRWRSVTSAIDLSEDGTWWLCRWPPLLDFFEKQDDQKLFLRCDDIDHGVAPDEKALTPERASKLTGVLAMSPPHRQWLLQKYPFLKPEQVHQPGAGMASDRLREIDVPDRDPHRLIWASSPDRGLDTLIEVFQAARRIEPALNLHVYYGWNSFDSALELYADHPQSHLKLRCMSYDQTNIVWHGRVPQDVLFEGYARSSFWVYPTAFPETACVAAMQAQAMGAIPICSPTFGLRSTVKNGVLVAGDPRERLTKARYIDSLIRLVENPELCDSIRDEMMPWALEEFDWERSVDLHENLSGCLRPWLVRTVSQTAKALETATA
jgi:glycosyltransferase involved in cell wall biosynthesis